MTTGTLAIALRMQQLMAPKPVKLRKPPRPKWPHRQAAEYYRDLRAVLERVHEAVKRVVLPQLPLIVAAHNVTRPEEQPIRTDAGTGDTVESMIEGLIDEVDDEVSPAKIEMLAQTNVVRTAAWHGAEFQKQVQQVAKINVWGDTTGLAEHLEVAVAENVRLIKSLTGKQLDDVKGIVLRGARAGVHQNEIAKQIEQSFGVSKRRAALIANDQVGKLNGELNQIRQQRLGVRRYRWSSSQDERVRKRHRQLNGTIQEWAKPPITDERTGERAHPGQPIRCRCQPIPIIDDVLVDAGLLDPSDVELGMPGGGRPPQPVPPGLPQPPPANRPPRPSARRQPPPPAPPPQPPRGGGSGGGGPPGGRPPGPPSEPERQRLVAKLRTGMGALPARGGDAPDVRGATQALTARYGLAPSHGQSRLTWLDVGTGLPPGLDGGHRADGSIALATRVAADIKTALSKLKRGVAVTENEANAVATLVHEELHAMGAVRTQGTYRDAGRLIEEVATETLTRDMTRALLGKKAVPRVHPNHPLVLPLRAIASRAYDSEIVAVLKEIRTIAGVDAANAQALLRAAALEFKRHRGTLGTPDAFAELFANSVLGLSATDRGRLADSLIALGQSLKAGGVR